MLLPQPLQHGIDDLVRGSTDAPTLERTARALSDSYRAGGPAAARAARTPGDVVAYLATRAPATFAAVAAVLEQVRAARPEWAPTSVLDLGAGPGIASWAALETWPGIANVTLVEAEQEMVRAGKTLAAAGRAPLQQAVWSGADATTAPGAGGTSADLVLASYLIGELPPHELPGFAASAWARARDTLVVVEPGTTAGYERVLSLRATVLAAGGSTLAPCPHDTGCPLPASDWCHFSVRLPRTRTHRLAKGAERGFEDEKFAYVALGRSPGAQPEARVIRRPDQRPGHVVLDLCTPAGLERRTVARREGAGYKRARKLSWGDAL